MTLGDWENSSGSSLAVTSSDCSTLRFLLLTLDGSGCGDCVSLSWYPPWITAAPVVLAVLTLDWTWLENGRASPLDPPTEGRRLAAAGLMWGEVEVEAVFPSDGDARLLTTSAMVKDNKVLVAGTLASLGTLGELCVVAGEMTLNSDGEMDAFFCMASPTVGSLLDGLGTPLPLPCFERWALPSVCGEWLPVTAPSPTARKILEEEVPCSTPGEMG